LTRIGWAGDNVAMSLAGDFQSFTPATAMTGVIVEWDAAKAFGYLECEGKRVFLSE
jgi:hypothetical protein